MRKYANSSPETEESKKIYTERIRIGTKIDMSAVLDSKLNSMKSKKKNKTLIYIEKFFEYMAGSDDEMTFSHAFLVTLAVFANCFIFFASIFGPIVEVVEKKRFHNFVEVIDDRRSLPLLTWHTVFLLPIVFFSCGLILGPPKYEYIHHFSHIDRNCLNSIIFFVFLYAVSTIGIMSLMSWLTILESLMFFIVLNNIIASINAQKATKLRFDPCEHNNLYKLVHAESKDKGTIRIVESSVFKITLKNIGSESWNSKGSVLHRHTGTGKKGHCFSTFLPRFTLSPQEQIHLIPEAAEYDGECVRIPYFHCFGTRDRHCQVTTFISFGRSDIDMLQEENHFVGCSYSKTKIAEHIATYNENEWSNIIPC